MLVLGEKGGYDGSWDCDLVMDRCWNEDHGQHYRFGVSFSCLLLLACLVLVLYRTRSINNLNFFAGGV